MDLFAALSPSATPSDLTEKYRPTSIADFVGLDKPKRVASKLASNPPETGSFMFVGDPGLGKTTLALAMAAQMGAELHHIPSQDCNLDTLKSVVNTCHYVPKAGCSRHLVLVDEADQMSAAAQMYLLSKLDSTGRVPNTIWVFTANATEKLHDRFISRCSLIPFSVHGESKQIASHLESVWAAETPASAKAPNFARIVKDACNNIRAALNELQTEILLAN